MMGSVAVAVLETVVKVAFPVTIVIAGVSIQAQTDAMTLLSWASRELYIGAFGVAVGEAMVVLE